MKKILLLFVFVLGAHLNVLMAQNDYNGFNLKDYYTPDIVRNALELNANLSGQSANSTNKTNFNTSENHNVQFSINDLDVNFSSLKNTRKVISTIGFGFSPTLDYQKYSSQDTLFTLGHSESAYWNNRLYYNSKYFITYNASLGLSGGYHNNYADGLKKDMLLNFTPSIGWGIGRIENVTDARQAIYILEDFKKNGILSRDLTKDELFEFAQLISTVKNKRFLDSRLHRIDEITTIDKYLKKKDVLRDNDATYFTSLYDMWGYGAMFTRNSGSMLSFNVAPLVRYFWSYDKTPASQPVYETKNISYGAIAGVGYYFSKPVKLNWQHDASANLNVDFEKYNDLIDNHLFTSYMPSLDLKYKLGYYPSTRTNIYAQAGWNILYQKYKGDTGYTSYNRLALGGGMNYYVSQNLRLSAYVDIANDLHKITSFESTSKNLGISYGASLTYLFY